MAQGSAGEARKICHFPVWRLGLFDCRLEVRCFLFFSYTFHASYYKGLGEFQLRAFKKKNNRRRMFLADETVISNSVCERVSLEKVPKVVVSCSFTQDIKTSERWISVWSFRWAGCWIPVSGCAQTRARVCLHLHVLATNINCFYLFLFNFFQFYFSS